MSARSHAEACADSAGRCGWPRAGGCAVALHQERAAGRDRRMMLADAHMHLFPEGYRRAGHGSLFGKRELEAYCALRLSHKIECALAIGYEADGLDPQNNAYLRRLAAEHDWLHSLAYVDPRAEPDPAA